MLRAGPAGSGQLVVLCFVMVYPAAPSLHCACGVLGGGTQALGCSMWDLSSLTGD